MTSCNTDKARDERNTYMNTEAKQIRIKAHEHLEVVLTNTEVAPLKPTHEILHLLVRVP